mmetsp:Transcript_30365/g.29730  ORF Transcript_30365/g.29730 Transcript_30365/m.29730 type:complete len:118 (-) Transcript_30365:4167-4520(-)
MANTLNVLKVGLFSANLEVCVACSRVLQKMAQEVNSELLGVELKGLMWDWFINDKQKEPFFGESYIASLEDITVPDISQNNSKLDNKDLGECGLSACVYAIKRHPGEYLRHGISVLV